jgi:nitrogen regulatory protein PII
MHGQTLFGNSFEVNAGPLRVVRRYWFSSLQGSQEDLDAMQKALRSFGYEAVLFRKVKGRHEKGVDLAVARGMLMHAFHKNYDVAVLIAGDEDYLGLIQDVKRKGRQVQVDRCFPAGHQPLKTQAQGCHVARQGQLHRLTVCLAFVGGRLRHAPFLLPAAARIYTGKGEEVDHAEVIGAARLGGQRRYPVRLDVM